MGTAVCWQCVKDEYLQKIIQKQGMRQLCSVCGKKRMAFTINELGGVLAPIIREHYEPGEQYRIFGEDDHDSWAQEGDQLSHLVQDVLGQYFDFNDEIVDAVVDSEYVDERDGEIAFLDGTAYYVEKGI